MQIRFHCTEKAKSISNKIFSTSYVHNQLCPGNKSINKTLFFLFSVVYAIGELQQIKLSAKLKIMMSTVKTIYKTV